MSTNSVGIGFAHLERESTRLVNIDEICDKIFIGLDHGVFMIIEQVTAEIGGLSGFMVSSSARDKIERCDEGYRLERASIWEQPPRFRRG